MKMFDDYDYNDDSLERALADLEMILAAYPDEITTSSNIANSFPLHFRLHLSLTCYFDLSMRAGYPTSSNIEITSFRCDNENKERMDAAATAIRKSARMCLQQQDDDDDNGGGGGTEGGLACCAAAMEAWNNHTTVSTTTTTTTSTDIPTSCTDTTETRSHDEYPRMDEEEYYSDNVITPQQQQQQQEQEYRCHYESSPSKCSKLHAHNNNNNEKFTWITGKPLVDRKSTFLAHACHVSCEADVKLALQQLLTSHSKYRRATHNMVSVLQEERIVFSFLFFFSRKTL
jgi:Uncharacterized protein family UPF0029